MLAPAGVVTGGVPLAALVTRPKASTVIFEYVYAPGVTKVVGRSTVNVPVVVIGPPPTVRLVLEIPTLETVPVAIGTPFNVNSFKLL